VHSHQSLSAAAAGRAAQEDRWVVIVARNGRARVDADVPEALRLGRCRAAVWIMHNVALLRLLYHGPRCVGEEQGMGFPESLALWSEFGYDSRA
jgi:hypothetical protein